MKGVERLVHEAVAAGRVTVTGGAGVETPAEDGATRRVDVLVPVATPNPLRGSHGHWSRRAKLVGVQSGAVWAALVGVPVATRAALSRGCTITLTRVSAGTLDDDNLRGSLKAVRDAVAAWLIPGLAAGRADGDERLGWVYSQERGKPRHPAVRILIESRT